MATVVNNPQSQPAPANNGNGFLLGVILLIIFVVLLFWYGIPYLTTAFQAQAPQVNVPSQVDVNVKQK